MIRYHPYIIGHQLDVPASCLRFTVTDSCNPYILFIDAIDFVIWA